VIKIYYAYTEIIDDSSFERIKAEMSYDERKHLTNLRRSEDRMLKVLSSALLLKALIDHGHDNFKICDMKKNEAGRPFFDAACFDFNISHSGNCAVLAFAEDSRIGIDIEEKNMIDLSDFENIFPHDVWKKINVSNDRIESFYHYWTSLESAVKADGRGLPILSSMQMDIDHDQIIIDENEWNSHHIDIDHSISCCTVSDKKDETIELVEIRSI